MAPVRYFRAVHSCCTAIAQDECAVDTVLAFVAIIPWMHRGLLHAHVSLRHRTWADLMRSMYYVICNVRLAYASSPVSSVMWYNGQGVESVLSLKSACRLRHGVPTRCSGPALAGCWPEAGTAAIGLLGERWCFIVSLVGKRGSGLVRRTSNECLRVF